MALLAAVGSGVDGVTEGCRGGPLDGEGDVFGFHALMAAIAVGGDGKGLFAVMAGSAGLSFFHLGHGHSFFFSGNDLAVVAALAGAARFGNVDGVAEGRLAESLDPVGYFAGFSLVTANTILLGGDAECLHDAVHRDAVRLEIHLRHGRRRMI